MSEQKRYELAPQTIKDLDYLIWCASSATSERVRNVAHDTLLNSCDENSIILLVDSEAMHSAPHEFDCDEQATYAFRVLSNLDYENLGPAYEFKAGRYTPIQYPTLVEEKAKAEKEAATAKASFDAEYEETRELVDALIEIKPALSERFGEGRVIDAFSRRGDGGFNLLKDALPEGKKHLAGDLLGVLAAGNAFSSYYSYIFDSDIKFSYDRNFYQKAARALARLTNPAKPKLEKRSEGAKSKKVDLSFLTFTDEPNQPKKEEPKYDGPLATTYTMRGKTYRFGYPSDADEEEIDRLDWLAGNSKNPQLKATARYWLQKRVADGLWIGGELQKMSDTGGLITDYEDEED